jgi:hypothetical protein
MYRTEQHDAANALCVRRELRVGAAGYRSGVDITGVWRDQRLWHAVSLARRGHSAKMPLHLGAQFGWIGRVEHAGNGGRPARHDRLHQ